MAQAKEQIQILVVNTDLAVERQNILRETLKNYFAGLNKQNPTSDRELVYVVNAENKPVQNVLVANKDADVLFTGFNISRKPKTDKKKKELILDDNQTDALDIDPTLRFPAILEMQKMVERGVFKQRRLILVGDLTEHIQFICKLGIDVYATVFTNAERTQVGSPIKISQPEQLAGQGQAVDVTTIDSLTIANIPFHGVINMTEEGNRFFIKDGSIVDTTKKIFQLEGVKEAMAKEAIEEEKLVFVRRKKVMIVLSPDIKKVVADRLQFDQMERLFEFGTKEEAIESLSTGKAQGVIEFLEEEGYDVVNSALDQDERDRMLVAMMGDQLYTALEQEMKTQGDHLKLMPEDFISDFFNGLPEKFVDRILLGLQGKSFDSFTNLVPPNIRESVILEFLKKPKLAIQGWKDLNPNYRKQILAEKAPDVLATLNLINTPLFKRKFPDIKFEFDQSYDSTQSYKTLTKEAKEFTYDLFKKGLSKKKFAQSVWSEKFSQEEFDGLISSWISMFAETFYNGLTPVIRKEIWLAVATHYKEEINKKLHFMDKVKIMEGNKETVLNLVRERAADLIAFFKETKKRETAGLLLVGLKRFNKVESKTALLKKILTNPKMKEQRMKGFNELLISEEGKPIYQKLTDEIEALSQGYDSLICMSADLEDLQAFEELKDANVTLVDKEVDPSLLEMFAKGDVNMDDYDRYSKEIEKRIAELRKQLREKGKDDPVAAYLLESMIVLMEMSTKAVKNDLDESAMKTLDERVEIKRQVIQGMEKNLVEIAQRLEANKGNIDQAKDDLRIEKAKQEKYNAVVGEQKDELLKTLNALKATKARLSKALVQKKQVALKQKNLSMDFFKIIRPLILDKMSSLPAPLEALIRAVKNQFFEEEELRRRVIFKFTDEEIRKIAKHDFVFVSDNELLKQFIVTCLDIDHLKNTLFSISGSRNVPDDPDVLFLGPELKADDFTDIVKEKYIVTFADKKFFNGLMKNESIKKSTKNALAKFMTDQKNQKAAAEKQGKAIKGMIRNKSLLDKKVGDMEKRTAGMVEQIKKDEETQHFLNAEKETLDEKFEQIDEKFAGVKSNIQTIVGQGDSALDALGKGSEELGKELSSSLMDISKEMGNMMFVKNVKEAGTKISKKTQSGIMNKMDRVSRYNGGKAGIKELVIAEDGSLDSQNLKRVVSQALSKHFGIPDSSIQEFKMGRLETNIVDVGKSYSFIVIIGDDRQNKLKNFQATLKKIRAKQKDSYIMMFSPYGRIDEKLNPEMLENISSLREMCQLVNTEIVDYTNRNRLNKFLREVAPA